VFSPDGTRLAYAARQGKTARVVLEPGRTTTTHRAVGEPVFSPDGRSLAYAAVDDGKERVVLDDVAGPSYNAIGKLTFSPDGRHLAYETRTGDKWRLVVDGVAGPEYGRLAELPEHPWRQAVVGWAFDGPNTLWYVGRLRGAIVRWEVSLKEAPTAP
jgi:dipeptidyl aminopeptidase/acylaminoacyl peptidase